MKLKYFTTEHESGKIERKVYLTEKGNILFIGKNYKERYYIDIFSDISDYNYDTPLARFHDESLISAKSILKSDFF